MALYLLLNLLSQIVVIPLQCNDIFLQFLFNQPHYLYVVFLIYISYQFTSRFIYLLGKSIILPQYLYIFSFIVLNLWSECSHLITDF